MNLFQFSETIHYLDILTILAILCLFVSLLVYYLIFFVSDSKLGNYKYYLIDITTWNFILCMNGAVFLRKDNAHGVPTIPVIRGLINVFHSQLVAHLVGLVEHISAAQIGISIVVCCFFKVLHFTVINKTDRAPTLKRLIIITISCHVASILIIGKGRSRNEKFIRARIDTGLPDHQARMKGHPGLATYGLVAILGRVVKMLQRGKEATSKFCDPLQNRLFNFSPKSWRPFLTISDLFCYFCKRVKRKF